MDSDYPADTDSPHENVPVPGHLERLTSLNTLASSFLGRYERSGNTGDLEDSISLFRNALILCHIGHPGRPTPLNNLAHALMRRYDELGRLEDMDDSISLLYEALSLRPPGHTHRSTSLNNLAHSLTRRYEEFGKIGDLEDSISFFVETLKLVPPDHAERSTPLNNLANALVSRYRQLGRVDDLEDSLSFSREALGLRPPGHPQRPKTLNNIAHSLQSRFALLGEIGDLDDSVSFQREALGLRLPGHPGRSTSLNNLAHALMSRYDHLGKMVDLEDAISLYREALVLRPPGHPGHSKSLNNLAHALMARYDQLGNIQDLEDSIPLYHTALTLLPHDHPERSTSINNVATALITRYEKLGGKEDLEDSISFYSDAVGLRKSPHPGRSLALNNLAHSLMHRYRQLARKEDLESSISFYRDALSLRPPGHPQRSTTLDHLADALMTRFTDFGEMSDLDDSVSFQRNALSLCPPGHPERSTNLAHLAHALMTRYEESHRTEDLQDIFVCYEEVANDSTSFLRSRLRAAIQWTIDARHLGHKSTLNAYTTSLEFLNRSLISRPSVESQQEFLSTTDIVRTLASDAASAAIDEGNLELAVELLEQSRSILWSRINSYKSPLQELRQVEGGEELADRLETLGAGFEGLALSSGRASEMLDKDASAEDAKMKQHRILTEEWEDIVRQVRKIDGFDHFLQAAPFHVLQSAGEGGPVVLVNVSDYHSDAIILLKERPLELVPLPDVRLVEVNSLKVRSAREVTRTLSYLWEAIVAPIVKRLIEVGIPKMSRIWWCPTGALCILPLHAAGYRKNNLQDIFISSYTSTLSSLIRARSKISAGTAPKLLVVGHPSEVSRLERVEVEVETVKRLGPGDSVDVLFGSSATSKAVTGGLKDHSWVHFACHGHLGLNGQPFQASFELYDRRLPILDLVQARLPDAELAFLSACHSAEGDTNTPDESIHLSAALQFCGFRSVVGTLWEMDDEDGPMISEMFYEYMFRDVDNIDFKYSAQALNRAVGAMRKAKLSADRWAMFVHIGA